MARVQQHPTKQYFREDLLKLTAQGIKNTQTGTEIKTEQLGVYNGLIKFNQKQNRKESDIQKDQLRQQHRLGRNFQLPKPFPLFGHTNISRYPAVSFFPSHGNYM